MLCSIKICCKQVKKTILKLIHIFKKAFTELVNKIGNKDYSKYNFLLVR